METCLPETKLNQKSFYFAFVCLSGLLIYRQQTAYFNRYTIQWVFDKPSQLCNHHPNWDLDSYHSIALMQFCSESGLPTPNPWQCWVWFSPPFFFSLPESDVCIPVRNIYSFHWVFFFMSTLYVRFCLSHCPYVNFMHFSRHEIVSHYSLQFYLPNG